MKNILAFFILVSLCAYEALACTNLLVSKGASKDGSVMVSYAADSHTRYGTLVYMPAQRHKPGEMLRVEEWGKNRFLGYIPQAEYTYNVIGNMNEHQLLIGESTWGGLPELTDTTAILDYGSLIYITLQRAKTAREAILLYTSLLDQYGYASSGESISFADPNEVWFMDIIARKPKYENGVNTNKGAVWVAIRIPDGYISAHANCARITTFPLNDPENCLYSHDVISQAREMGLFNGRDEEFSFADTYGPLDFSGMRACEARVWSFFNKHGVEDMGKYLDHARGDNPSNRLPLYVKPKEKLSVKDVADMMRDHYEGTEFDMTRGIGAGGNALPYRWRPSSVSIDGKTAVNERAIATQQTGFWFVGQCRGWLPNHIGGLFWFAVDDAGTSPLSPFYACSNRISEHYALGNGNMIEYSPTSMFWLQNRIAQFAYLRYNHIGKEVRENIDRHELEMIEAVKAADAAALAMSTSKKGSSKDATATNAISQKDASQKNASLNNNTHKGASKKAVKYLTDFSVEQAAKLFEKWSALDKYLLVKYIDGNTKHQNPDGSFKNNGHCTTIPPAPAFPGYTDEFKRAMVNE